MKTIHTSKCSVWRNLALLIVVVILGNLNGFAQKKPNIVFIMGDDIGWFNIGAYHQGMMAGKTPNLDKLASEGMRFTDYYAEASCTAGRANFITGELPIRTGLTTVGQAGSTLGLPAQAPTIATVLKSMGYATGQFGKNHLGDHNEFLPTVHGFDEFFGYLYHLDAMEDPCHRNYPPTAKETVGPRQDGGQTPFAAGKGTVMEGGFRAPAMVRWPGHVPAGKIENGIMSGLDWFPTLVAAAGNPNIVQELKKGKQIGDRSYKVHLDGYNQTDLIMGSGPSKRNEIFYFAENTLGAVRIGDYKYRFIDQPNGWLGGTVKVDWPILVNLRLDPFERTGLSGSLNYYNWFAYEFWRFAFVQKEVAKAAQSFIEFPPMQKGASFNLERLKEELEKKAAAQASQ